MQAAKINPDFKLHFHRIWCAKETQNDSLLLTSNKTLVSQLVPTAPLTGQEMCARELGGPALTLNGSKHENWKTPSAVAERFARRGKNHRNGLFIASWE